MPLVVLHTSDWHLGARLAEQPRLDEHALFLDWLIEQLKTHQVDLLLVAGDIFDHANPPNAARELYYRFLARMSAETGACAVIVAGNHDSAGVIDAPSRVLEPLRVRVVGSAPTNTADLLLPVVNKQGEVAAWVAAVPFLRGGDLPAAGGAETVDARHKRLVCGIEDWYSRVDEAAAECLAPEHAFIATGHLFVTGSTLSDTERGFQVGHQAGIPAHVFPSSIDYVALGHLHRPQHVSDAAIPMVYPGSPIPLSFKEAAHEQGAELVTFSDEGMLIGIERLVSPRWRTMALFQGDPAQVLAQIEATAPLCTSIEGGAMRGWASVKITLDEPQPDLRETLSEALFARGYDLLQVVARRAGGGAGLGTTLDISELETLDEIGPEEVFCRLFRREHDADPSSELLAAFLDLLQADEAAP